MGQLHCSKLYIGPPFPCPVMDFMGTAMIGDVDKLTQAQARTKVLGPCFFGMDWSW